VPDQHRGPWWRANVSLDHLHFFGAIDLAQLDADALTVVCGQVLSNMVGSDGELSVATVNEDCKAHQAGPPDCGECVESGPHCPPAVENIVN
jgi:hypothetical protein